MNRTYIVKKGDTLTRIAAQEGVDRYELTSLNGIRNHNLIRVDQVLRLPPRPVEVAPTEQMPLPVPELDPLSCVACQFIDAANQPIDGMDVNLTIGPTELRYVTDSEGFVPAVSLEAENREGWQAAIQKLQNRHRRMGCTLRKLQVIREGHDPVS